MHVGEAGQHGEVVAVHDFSRVGNAHQRAGTGRADTSRLDDQHRRLDGIATGSVDQSVGNNRKRRVWHRHTSPMI